jgi:hypothetical protein
MVLKNYRTLSSTQSYDGTAQTITTDLPRDFLVQRIILDFHGTTTLSGTSVLVTNALLRCVKNIRIKAVGEGSSRTIVDIKGEDLYYLNLFDYGFGTALDNTDTTASAHTQMTGWTIDMRIDKQNPDDFSVSIPSYLLSTLQLEIEYDTSANGYGTNVSAQSFTMGITLIEGIPEPSESFAKNPLMTLLQKQLSGDSSTGDEDFDTFFTVGSLIRRSFLLVQTSASAPSDTELTSYTVQSGQIPLMSKINYRANKTKDIENYRVAENPSGFWDVTGYTFIDFANNQQPFVPTASGLKIDGLSTVGYNVGDLKITMNKAVASAIFRRTQESVEG